MSLAEKMLERLGHDFTGDDFARATRAAEALATLTIRHLSGEDVRELQGAVDASFANLRAEGAIQVADAVTSGLRDGIESLLEDLIGPRD